MWPLTESNFQCAATAFYRLPAAVLLMFGSAFLSVDKALGDVLGQDGAPPTQPIPPGGSCNNLIPAGAKMSCYGSEPDWALKFVCSGSMMRANFSTSWSGEKTGTVSFSGQNPWTFRTSHSVVGSIDYTPRGCLDDNAERFDYTLRATAVPELDGRVEPICCRIE